LLKKSILIYQAFFRIFTFCIDVNILLLKILHLEQVIQW